MRRLVNDNHPAGIKGKRETHRTAIVKHLKKTGTCPCWSFKCGSVFIRCPEKVITILRESNWPIDTYRKPDGDGSVFFLDTEPAGLIDQGWEPLFMGLNRGAVAVKHWSRRKITNAFKKRRLSP
jgi:hypothetical protein